MSTSPLALDGGTPVISAYPKRHLFGDEEKAAVAALFDQSIASGDVFGYDGPEEQAYCKEFADYMGGGYADGVNSGTCAVYVALRAARVKAYSEVICGPISDPGGIMPIALMGCIPIPADGAPGSFNMDPASIAERLTDRTGAIVVAHIAGIPADMDAILRLARARGIPVIEDCAQAHGAIYQGRLCGSLGDVGAFSTMSGKHHASGAQGGLVYTRSEETYWQARRCSDRGKPYHTENAQGNQVAALNLNSNDLNACIGRVQLRKLPAILTARRQAAKHLIAGCQRELRALRILDGADDTLPSYWFLFGQLDLSRLRVDKATFVKALRAEGVQCAPSYLHLFTDHDWYRHRRVLEGSQFPWDSPHYTGDAKAIYPTPVIRETDRCTFQLGWHERIDTAFADRLLEAFKKVENAYLA